MKDSDKKIKDEKNKDSLVIFFRSFCFKLGFYFINIFYGLISLIVAFLPQRFHKPFLLNYGTAVQLWLRFCCRLDSQIIGQANIPDQPCVILCKHSSTWETIALSCFFDVPVAVAKRSLINIPFFGWILRLSHPILIDRGKSSDAMKQVLDLGKKHLDRGRSIFMFPEGTRAKPGQSIDYKVGGFLLAKKAVYPLLPVTHNAGDFWSNSRFVIYPGTIKVVIGSLVDSNQLSLKELLQQTQSWIEAEAKKII